MKKQLLRFSKIYVLLFALLFVGQRAQAQYVTIPDTAFVQYLQITFPGCMNVNRMDTTCPAIVNAKGVYCSGELSSPIKNLYGIQYFKNLDTLICSFNSLTSLAGLPGTVKYLDCGYNYTLATLPALPNALTFLSCNLNNLTALPALPSSLAYLDCHNNKIVTLPTLPSSLTALKCSVNKLKSLPALPADLLTLDCSQNAIRGPLSAFPPNAIYINIGQNPGIHSLPALPATLSSLYCYSDSLSSLPALPGSLILLQCFSNQLTSLPLLPDSLINFSCASNFLTSLPVLPNKLQQLLASANFIHSFPALPASVINFDCGYDTIISLPALPAGLRYLSCVGCGLAALPPLPSNLVSINCSYNPALTSLPDLPKSITALECRNCTNINCLPPLPPVLQYLYFDSTGITCLPNIPTVSLSVPLVSSVPLCSVANTHGCAINWNIGGSVFFDNSNCTYHTGDVLLSPVKINLFQNGSLLQQTYSRGTYSFKTDLSTYTVALDTADFPFDMTCHTGYDSVVKVTALDSTVQNVDFAVKCKNSFDIAVWDVHVTNPFFPGNTSGIYITAGDRTKLFKPAGCNTSNLSGTVTVTFNGPVNYIGPLSGALTPVVNGDSLIYTIADFSAVNLYTDFAFSVSTNTNATTSNHVCFTVNVTPTAGDMDTLNNTLSHCFGVTNSYDPNEKEVSPIGNLPTGYSDWLTYTIHFQNTGTAAAQHIQVLDTLDANIDASTFQLLSYSVLPTVQIKGNIVLFDFPNIFLPDSTSSSDGSKGYVEYRVKPTANRSEGTTITNTASIYFDYNAPVRTNTTASTFGATTGIASLTDAVALTVYPNPATNRLSITYSNFQPDRITIYDVNGQKIMEQKFNPQLDIAALSAGVYFVEVKGASTIARTKFIKM